MLLAKIIEDLETQRMMHGSAARDATHVRSVHEVLFPRVIRMPLAPFEDESEFLSAFTVGLIERNWDMWYTSFCNLVLPQINADRNTRRSCLSFPHHCMVTMSFYARGKHATVFGYWRSLELSKVPADMILFRRIADLFKAHADCGTGVCIAQIGSYHKEIG